jgi:NAD(P) transhydrogenase subunit beta
VSETPLLIELAYLASSILFIIGLKRLSSPATARSGNLLASYGMGLVVAATLALPGLLHWPLILAMLALGIALGIVGARTVPMTDMPQMVAFLNGLGGGGAALVSILEFQAAVAAPALAEPTALYSGVLGTIIGTLSFVGSVVACGKLTGMLSEKPLQFPGLQFLNAVLFASMLGCGAFAVSSSAPLPWFYAMLAVASAFGAMLVLPIGGADMPVVISLLNSFTGLAAAATGFVLGNNALIISGTLVGASGTLLTQLMCKAMNRSLANVLFAGFGGGGAAAAAGPGKSASGRIVREVTVDDAAMLLANVQSLVIVPGYGMAVAQAQHSVREMAEMLGKRGIDVKYAIHPVAGRMPGHMNVLLAEANVPYDQLYDIDQINPEFERTDVALIIGANDVVNPAARADTTSPIYGMPILDADKARHVIIIKRSLNAGFAGIDNELYYDPRCSMLFGDAKGAVQKLIEALKTV